MKRPCECNRAKIGGPWDSSQCRPCWHAMNTQEYRILWGIVAGALPVDPRPVGRCCGQDASDLAYGQLDDATPKRPQ